MIDLENGVFLGQVEDLAARRRWPDLRDMLTLLEPADIAAVLAELPADRLPVLYRLLPKELAAEVFVEMEPEEQEVLIKSFSDTELREVLEELYVDDTVDLIEEMPASVVKRILRHTDPETRRSVNEILRYPEDSAGSIMTTEFVDLKRDMTVSDAIKRIRRTGSDKETINICYVTDPSRHLLGLVSIRTLVLADEEDIIEDIMETNIISAALDGGDDVHLALVGGSHQGLTDDHLQGVKAEILLDVATVDGNGAGAAGINLDAGHGGLPTASAVQIRLLRLIHVPLPPYSA